MTETEYRELVLTYFDQKLAFNELPLELVSPTRRSLKDHCINICTQRFAEKDELLLSSMFGHKENQAAYIKAIQNTSADDFRTIHNFLNDRSINTGFNNICLLAWMIGFEPRPYHPGLKYSEQIMKIPEVAERETLLGSEPEVTIPPRKNTNIVLVLGGLTLLFLSSLFVIKTTRPTGREGCMIWRDDHYEPINCSERSNLAHVYPINRSLVENFQKISRPDTLTLHSVRRVWYIKSKGRVEFYTAPGPYPLDSSKRLLPMTDHILKKYVYHLTD
jgi:hypothetical protein